MVQSLTGFLVCGVVIFLAGKKLSYYGDMIAGLSGMGKGWVGLILMASVTSLPELMVGISSSAIVQSADLAVGNILGSCSFNLGILALMDAFVPRRMALLGTASQTHIMAAALGIILLAVTGASLFLPQDIVLSSWIGITSLLFIVIYLMSIRIIYVFEARNKPDIIPVHEEKTGQPITLKKAIGMYSAFATVIIAAALFLPRFAEEIANATGLGKTFVGTLFLAASTSLPEIAVSIAAVRMGFIDLSVGNLLGSNLFNIFTLAIDDIFYTKGHILKDASDAHIVSVIATIIMSAIAIIGLTFHSEKKRYRMAFDSILIFLVYILNMILLYKLTSV